MAKHESQLIVIRGNSATGKTTLARELQLAMGRGTANVGQDHFRRTVLREHDVPDGDNISLIEHNVRFCLDVGYHVIVEGILLAEHYGHMLRSLVASHSGPHHLVYLDLSLDESLARHAGRRLSKDVPADRLREWYLPRDLLGFPGEVVLDANISLPALVGQVMDRVRPVTARPIHPSARFL